jgi:hypothetical protein
MLAPQTKRSIVMSIVLRFPIERRVSCKSDRPDAPAQIVILPCVRIERHAEPIAALPATRESRPAARPRRCAETNDAAET